MRARDIHVGRTYRDRHFKNLYRIEGHQAAGRWLARVVSTTNLYTQVGEVHSIASRQVHNAMTLEEWNQNRQHQLNLRDQTRRIYEQRKALYELRSMVLSQRDNDRWLSSSLRGFYEYLQKTEKIPEIPYET